jgi:hypothetical protein
MTGAPRFGVRVPLTQEKSMVRSRAALLLLVPFLFPLMAFRQSPLVDPAPIPLSAKVSEDQATKAIKMALLHRGWETTAEKPGEIDATLHLRDHVAEIAVAYDASSIQIRYVNSTNLKYEVQKDGSRLIHTNYLSWINNIVLDIQTNLILFGG